MNLPDSKQPAEIKTLAARLRRVAAWFLYGFYLTVTLVLLLEFSYRFQLIDFYKTELRALNRTEDLAPGQQKKTILIGGDSFSAQASSYAAQLRDSLPAFRIVNAAVSGSSAIEASYLLPRRVHTFQPDIFIYQLYVGNDLLPYRHPIHWTEGPLARNLYWWLSERLHVLAYINYRLGQWNWHVGHAGDAGAQPPEDEAFAVDKYRWRERVYAQVDPYLISHSALLQQGREEDMHALRERLETIVEDLDTACRVYLLVIPHKAQVNAQYRDHMRAIGFRFEPDFSVDAGSFPFADSVGVFARAHRFSMIDMLLALRAKEATDGPLYYQNDEHLSAAGQSLVARTLLRAIQADTAHRALP